MPEVKRKVMVVFGTRPEAIKMAPVVQVLQNDPRFETIVTVTGQHREMLDQVLQAFAITPHHDLNIMQHGQSLTDIAVRSLRGLEPILQSEQPHMMLVHGDTLTTFVASWAAFIQQIPVGHVEAGLRTDERYNPFPEEMNRRLTGAIAELHFAPTLRAKNNLLKENVDARDIFVVGNTVVDALLTQVANEYEFHDETLSQIDFDNRRVLLITTHRRENIGEPMRQIYTALRNILRATSDTDVVFPIHKNPIVRELAAEMLGDEPRVHFIEPPEYETFAHLMSKSYMILTDSGGIQEEAPALGKPVLVLRDTTERPEGIAAGTCVQVGTDSAVITQKALELLTDKHAYNNMAQAVNPYGDGKAALRIADAMAYALGIGKQRPQEFIPDPVETVK